MNRTVVDGFLRVQVTSKARASEGQRVCGLDSSKALDDANDWFIHMVDAQVLEDL